MKFGYKGRGIKFEKSCSKDLYYFLKFELTIKMTPVDSESIWHYVIIEKHPVSIKNCITCKNIFIIVFIQFFCCCFLIYFYIHYAKLCLSLFVQK